MKTQVIRFITKVTLLSAIVILTSVASVQAQSLAYRVKFTVPFDFVSGEKKFSAGKYSVGRAIHSSDDLAQLIASEDGDSKAVVLSNAVFTLHPNTRAQLVFHRYGNEYFLVQVWPAGGTHGRQFPESKQERALQRQLVMNPSGGTVSEKLKCETITIAAVAQ